MDWCRNPPADASSGAIRDVALFRTRTSAGCRRGVVSAIVPHRVPMSVQSETSTPSPDHLRSAAPLKAKRSMSRTQKLLFFATGWLIVLMPFLFWWNTWFGRHLSDQQLTEYLHDDKKPR